MTLRSLEVDQASELQAAKHWVVPGSQLGAKTMNGAARTTSSLGRMTQTALCVSRMRRAMLAEGLYDDKDTLKDGLLDPECIEAREWNLSAGQYKPFDFTQLKSERTVTELIGTLKGCGAGHHQGPRQAVGNGGGAGMTLPESWIQTTVRAVVSDLQPGFAQKPGDEDEGTTPQIRTHNVTPNGKISLAGIKHITASERELARYSLAARGRCFQTTRTAKSGWARRRSSITKETSSIQTT